MNATVTTDQNGARPKASGKPESDFLSLAADPKEYKMLGSAQVIGRTLSSIAISDGFGFVRDDFGVLKCLDLKK